MYTQYTYTRKDNYVFLKQYLNDFKFAKYEK